MTIKDAPSLGDNWSTWEENVTWETGKSLAFQLRYDGNGNSIVRWVVSRIGEKKITYEKYDAAVYNYNRPLKQI